jgi:hypothetical protein
MFQSMQNPKTSCITCRCVYVTKAADFFSGRANIYAQGSEKSSVTNGSLHACDALQQAEHVMVTGPISGISLVLKVHLQ